jgi:SAM-dependent methyltransferase
MRFGGTAKSDSEKSTAKPAAGVITRHSSGFDQFCSILHTPETLSILDIAGASQANISFITGLGHRISSDDILSTMEQCFGTGDFIDNQQMASNAQRFLDQSLTFPDAHFDGALVWDTLQFLTPPLIDQAVEQLLRVIRPGGLILTFFNADEKATRIPVYNYRIQDQKTLLLVPRGSQQRVQYYNNRALERLFEKAGSLKFFLTRDHLREVIVRR